MWGDGWMGFERGRLGRDGGGWGREHVVLARCERPSLRGIGGHSLSASALHLVVCTSDELKCGLADRH